MAHNIPVVTRDLSSNDYTAHLDDVLTVQSGDTVVFETWDPRYGALLDRPAGEPFVLPRPDNPKKLNPVTGPLHIQGARPGDALLVEILAIDLEPLGWCGTHANHPHFTAGTNPEAFGRICNIHPDRIEYSPDITLPLRPMIGCIGTGPLEPLNTMLAGKHGGNMDMPVITTGTKVLLPVYVDGAKLFIGDVHSSQGDGELSGVGLENPASVTVNVTVIPGAAPEWPWLRYDGWVSVLTVGKNFEEAANLALEQGVRLVSEKKQITTPDAITLVSLTSNMRVGAYWGGPQTTTRLELPDHLGVFPPGL